MAEFAGTAALVAVVVGSGIMAADLSRDVGVRLLANSLATAAGLAVLIVILGPVSGAHFNLLLVLLYPNSPRPVSGSTHQAAADQLR
ncbi:aquaporin [Nonomuraea sp. NPDC049750]|uniref:aquaporin n=1 Tax=Nonomuraea sp. NPDC049750 TaxID=3154738 RepID=UPI0033FA4335